MLWCLNNFKIWISLDTLSTSETSIILSFSRILMATFSPVNIWVATFTFPNVPSPKFLPSRIMYYYYQIFKVIKKF